jgi:hypothetical protein
VTLKKQNGIIYFVVQTFGKFKTFQKLCENRSILSHFYNLYHKVDNSETKYRFPLKTLSLASLAKRGRGGSFFGQSPKNEPLTPSFAREASESTITTLILKSGTYFLSVTKFRTMFGVAEKKL